MDPCVLSMRRGARGLARGKLVSSRLPLLELVISGEHSRTREECEGFHECHLHEYSHSIVNLRLSGTVNTTDGINNPKMLQMLIP